MLLDTRRSTAGYQMDPAEIVSRTFDVGSDELVIVRDIEFVSYGGQRRHDQESHPLSIPAEPCPGTRIRSPNAVPKFPDNPCVNFVRWTRNAKRMLEANPSASEETPKRSRAMNACLSSSRETDDARPEQASAAAGLEVVLMSKIQLAVIAYPERGKARRNRLHTGSLTHQS